jgi:hypothetical protein
MATEEQTSVADAVEGVELTAEQVTEVTSKVLEANPGKSAEELAAEIEAEKSSTAKAISEQNAADLKAIDEMKSKPENEGKTDEEIWDLIVAQEEEANADSIFENPFEVKGETLEKEKEAKAPEALALRVKELEQDLSDPLIADLVAFRKTGGSVEAFLANIGSVVDYSKLSAKEVVKAGIELYFKNGIYSEDDREIELSLVDDMLPSDAVIKSRAYMPDLVKSQADSVSKYARQPVENANNTAAAWEKTKQEVSEIAKNISGKGYHGWNIPQKSVEEAAANVLSGKLFTKADGTLNATVLIEAALWATHKHDILKAATEKAKLKGIVQERKKRVMPSRSNGVVTRPMSDASKNQAYQDAREKLKVKPSI